MEQWVGHNVQRGGEHEAGQEFEIENEVLVGQSMEQRADLEQEEEAVRLDKELQEANSLDPFLHPLVEEIKDLFINGKVLLLCGYS